jgi:hypothetical protein
MNFRRFRLLLSLSLLAVLVAVLTPESGRTRAKTVPNSPAKKPVQVLKVGITEYQNIERD